MRGARPERRLERIVEEALPATPGESVLIACSGGPDSVALAALVTATRPASAVVLGHVNHGVRECSWQDEGVVLALGVALRVRVVCASIDSGGSGEAGLRTARYAALEELARRAGAVRVCTAHHAEDQTETVLLALFRGTGTEGLAGMPAERALSPDLVLNRPLLRVGRGDLLEYCRRERLPYSRDETNGDLRYRRNALRLALDGLRESFPRLDEAVARCAEIVRDGEQSGRAQVRAQLRRRLAEQAGGARDVPFERLEAAARLIESGGTGRVFIKDGVELTVRRPLG